MNFLPGWVSLEQSSDLSRFTLLTHEHCGQHSQLGYFLGIFLKLKKNAKLISAAVLVLILLSALFSAPFQRQIHSLRGVQTRKELWLTNWHFFQQRPLTGVGWKHNAELSKYYLKEKLHTDTVFSSHAHNNFLEMLGGTGIVGTLSWLIWCGGVFWILAKQYRKPRLHRFPSAWIWRLGRAITKRANAGQCVGGKSATSNGLDLGLDSFVSVQPIVHHSFFLSFFICFDCTVG